MMRDLIEIDSRGGYFKKQHMFEALQANLDGKGLLAETIKEGLAKNKGEGDVVQSMAYTPGPCWLIVATRMIFASMNSSQRPCRRSSRR